jgi:hypothetical protein
VLLLSTTASVFFATKLICAWCEYFIKMFSSRQKYVDRDRVRRAKASPLMDMRLKCIRQIMNIAGGGKQRRVPLKGAET